MKNHNKETKSPFEVSDIVKLNYLMINSSQKNPFFLNVINKSRMNSNNKINASFDQLRIR